MVDNTHNRKDTKDKNRYYSNAYNNAIPIRSGQINKHKFRKNKLHIIGAYFRHRVIVIQQGNISSLLGTLSAFGDLNTVLYL